MPRHFIQSSVAAAAVTDPYSATFPLYDIVTNTTSLCVLRTKCKLGDTGYPSPGGEGVINDWGKAYELVAYGLLSTDATPGNLTIGVRTRAGHNDGGNAYVTLNSVTFTPDASLSNTGFELRGILLGEPQYPRSVSAPFSFVGRLTYTSGGAAKSVDITDTGTGQTGFHSVTVPAENLEAQAYVQWASALSTNKLQVRQMAWFQR